MLSEILIDLMTMFFVLYIVNIAIWNLFGIDVIEKLRCAISAIFIRFISEHDDEKDAHR